MSSADLKYTAFRQKRAIDTMRCVWLCHNLETFQKRLKALEERVARTGEVLTESPLNALQKAAEEKIIGVQIETEPIGYQTLKILSKSEPYNISTFYFNSRYLLFTGLLSVLNPEVFL